LKAISLGLLAVFILALALAQMPTLSVAASPSSFSAASTSISTAFVAVSQAQQDGGNVTGLVASLNTALGLYAKAQGENGNNPALALTDLQNATAMAQQVTLAAPAIGQAGLSARQAQEYLSVGSAAGIVAIAALLYVYGERIYHRLWLRLYSGYTVKTVG
jgi:hypothetical protein